VKALTCLISAALIAATCAAGQADIDAVMAEDAWAGCVFQPGYEPYPIALKGTSSDQLAVVYPTLCQGVHVVGHPGFDGDGAEFIIGEDHTCIPAMSVAYTVTGAELRIDYAVNGQAEGYALLAPLSAESNLPACGKSEATS